MKIESKDKINSFKITLYNNFIPLFVMRYLNIKKIDHLENIKKKETDILTYQEIKNIKIVIDYLKKTEKEKNKFDKKFEIMNFDFDSPFLFVNSAKLFFIAFLNTYFVKKTRIEMMERCQDLLGNLNWYSKTKLYTYRTYDTFAGLLSFIEIFNHNKKKSKKEVDKDHHNYSSNSDSSNEDTSKSDDETSENNTDDDDKDNEYDNYFDKDNNDEIKLDDEILNENNLENVMKRLNSDENDFCIYYNDFIELFQCLNVPRVVGIDILDEFYHDSDLPDSHLYQQSDKELPNSIVYQLQFIFDRLESIKSLFIVERLMHANRCFKNIKSWPKPPYDVIHLKVVKKNQFTQLKKTIKKIDQKEIKNKETQFNSDEIKPKTFENRHISETPTKIPPKMIKNKATKGLTINENDEENYWNPIDSDYLVENGIMYSKNEPKQETNDFMNQIKETDDNIQKQMKFKKDKTIRKKTLKPETKKQPEQLDLAMQITKRSSSYNFVTKLYKLLIFDETKMQWIFDSETFNRFSNDKKINAYGSRTPLIFYFNSNEDDIITVNSYFIMGLYPPLDSNQIFVYVLSERELSKINTTNDFSSQEKMITKPIFLILHIPKEKSKQPFIRKAISQLYIFFSSICDLSICIYNETYIKYQIELLNDLLAFCNNEKLNIALLKNNAKAEYNFKYDENVHKLSVLKMSNEKIIRFYLSDFDNFDSFKPFMDYFVKVSLESQTIFSKVKSYFKDFNLSHISLMYIRIITNNFWKEELKKVIENRFLILKSKDPNFEKKPEIVLNQLHKEFTIFLPINNSEFRNECNLNYSLMRKSLTKINDDFVREELLKSSKENIEILKRFFSDKNYWTLNQINNIINSHTRFLRKEYFNIIKSISDSNIFTMIYQDNKDTLEKQIKDDEKLIKEMSEPIVKIFKEKNQIKKVKAEEVSKKGTNYTLKETENLRELKIEVKTIDKLESVIEQDF